MATEIFSFGDFNTAGICQAICGQWIKKSRYKARYQGDMRGVTSLEELGTQSFLHRIWDEANDDDHISRNNLLGTPLETKAYNVNGFGASLDPVALARDITMGSSRYFLFGFNFYDGNGHALAAKSIRTQDGLQFVDPNYSCWKFDSKLEMYNFVLNHIRDKYCGQHAFKKADVVIYPA